MLCTFLFGFVHLRMFLYMNYFNYAQPILKSWIESGANNLISKILGFFYFLYVGTDVLLLYANQWLVLLDIVWQNFSHLLTRDKGATRHARVEYEICLTTRSLIARTNRTYRMKYCSFSSKSLASHAPHPDNPSSYRIARTVQSKIRAAPAARATRSSERHLCRSPSSIEHARAISAEFEQHRASARHLCEVRGTSSKRAPSLRSLSSFEQCTIAPIARRHRACAIRHRTSNNMNRLIERQGGRESAHCSVEQGSLEQTKPLVCAGVTRAR